ncbi:MAG: O-antigen ligase family protein [Sulfurimonas sp.]|nr:O-antigen ligase family protein [Sulfurimonas sp.]
MTYNNIPPSDPTPFMNHTDYSTFLSFTLIIIFSKLFTHKDRFWKILYSLYFITALSNLFINGGRTGQVTFLFTVITLSIFYFKLSLTKVFAILILLITLLVFAYNTSPNFHNRINKLQVEMSNMYLHHDFRGSLSIRFALWKLGTAIFFDNPLLGTGIGGETKQLKEYRDKYNFKIKTIYSDYHNTFVQYAVQLGIVGLLIPIIVFYLLFTLKFKTREYKMLSVAFSTIYLLHAMGGFSFHILDSLVFLSVFAALFNAITHIEKSTS